MAMKPFPKPFLEHTGPPYNQEHIPHETQGWCASPVLRAVNGRLMREWNTGSCGSNLNFCIKIPIIAATPILNLSNKIPYGVSVPFGTEAQGLLRPFLSLSITLIETLLHTLLCIPASSFCLLLCLGAFSSASDQCPGLYQQLENAGGFLMGTQLWFPILCCVILSCGLQINCSKQWSSH